MIDQLIFFGAFSALGYIGFNKLLEMLQVKRIKGTYFNGKTVLITGASSGIGKAIAEEMYPLGAQLILCARSKDQLEQLKKDLIKSGPGKEPEVLILDVASNIEIVQEKMNLMYSKFGRIDVLINNAGVSFRGESFSTEDKVFQKIFDVNFFGIVRLTNLVVNRMIKHNGTVENSKKEKSTYSIVNIGSVQSYIGTPYRSAYCSTKFALLAYSDSLRAELYAHENISIINCQPGYVNTNVSVNAFTNDGSANKVNDDQHIKGFDPNHVGQVVIDSILLKRKEILITVFMHRIGLMARFLFPNIFAKMMSIRAKKMFAQKFQD